MVNKVWDPRAPPWAPLKFEDIDLVCSPPVRLGLKLGSCCHSRRSTKGCTEQAACHVAAGP